ncbi:MAG: LysM peptidoglycan-binding domain-containing protein [Chloroflexota bacterium]|nr:LysM peptidoglycan-binding domain-containing protein [Chloroflexota bacterium]
MSFYIVGLAIILGLAALLWQKYKSGEDWQREASFFVDLLAMSATALIVGTLAFAQLSREPSTVSTPLADEEEPLTEETRLLEVEAISPEELESGELTVKPTEEPEREAEPVAASEPTATARPTQTPTPRATNTVQPTATPEPTATATPAETETYTVKAGDRLGSIAQGYGVTIEQIAAANPGLNADNLRIGQEILIPTGNASSSSPAPASTTRTYQVRAGDQLNTIAELFGVTIERILAVNPGLNADQLRIGQVITIP